MRAAHAQGLFLLERAALGDAAEPAHVLDDDVECLGDEIAHCRVAQVGARHAEVHPAARLGRAFGDLRVDVACHDGRKRDDVVVRDLFDLVDFRDGKVGMRANPRRLLLRDADAPELCLCLAGEYLDFLPHLELVLQRPDMSHLRAGIAFNHGQVPFEIAFHGRRRRLSWGSPGERNLYRILRS